MTAEIKINLLTPADGELLRAEGQGRKTRKTTGRRYLGNPCPERWGKETDSHHAGNDDSCYYKALKCKKNSKRSLKIHPGNHLPCKLYRQIL